MANIEHEGQSPAKPKHIMLGFHALYPNCKFSKPKVTIFTDGESIEIGISAKRWRDRQPDEEGVAFRYDDMKGDKCLDSLAMFISQKNFLKIVNARNVEVQVGDFRFKLNEPTLEALRDLASRMVL